ncbi:hypothetical protein ACFL43_00325 [Thermodesulfobacteriota bacterium]
MHCTVSLTKGAISYKKVDQKGNEENLNSSSFESLLGGKKPRSKKTVIIIVSIIMISSLIIQQIMGLDISLLACVAFMCMIIWYLFEKKSTKFKFDYEFDSHGNESWKALKEGFDQLQQADKTWQIVSSRKQKDWKRSGGATATIDRQDIEIGYGFPLNIESNIKVPIIVFQDRTMYLLPDKILFNIDGQISETNYSGLNLNLGASKFIERESVPKDAKVVEKTWLKVAKNGGPDKRFKDNKQIPVCLYEELTIKKGDFNHCIQVSKEGSAEKFANALLNYSNGQVVQPSATASTHSQKQENIEGPTMQSNDEDRLKNNNESISLNDLQTIYISAIVMASLDGDVSTKKSEMLVEFLSTYWKKEYGSITEFGPKAQKEAVVWIKSQSLSDKLDTAARELSKNLSEDIKTETLRLLVNIAKADGKMEKVEEGMLSIFVKHLYDAEEYETEDLKKIIVSAFLMATLDGKAEDSEGEIIGNFLQKYWKSDAGDIQACFDNCGQKALELRNSKEMGAILEDVVIGLKSTLNDKQKTDVLNLLKRIMDTDEDISKAEITMYKKFENYLEVVEAISSDDLGKIFISAVVMAGLDGEIKEEEIDLAIKFFGKYWRDEYGDQDKYVDKVRDEAFALLKTDGISNKLENISKELSSTLTNDQKTRVLNLLKEIMYTDDEVQGTEMGMYTIFAENLN